MLSREPQNWQGAIITCIVFTVRTFFKSVLEMVLEMDSSSVQCVLPTSLLPLVSTFPFNYFHSLLALYRLNYTDLSPSLLLFPAHITSPQMVFTVQLPVQICVWAQAFMGE